MPIEFKFSVEAMTKDRFHEIDYKVMGHAFDIQNEYGRLFDESIYHSEVIQRCANDGFSVISEGEIVVSHSTFSKSYFIDALVEGGAIYEFKAAESLNGHHESQLLNYMFLLGVSEGKLVNFSPPSVQHRFVSSTVTVSDWFSYTIETEGLDEQCPVGGVVRAIIEDLLSDLGAFLDIGLYREILFHQLGGEERL
jgi:GxxExxY protein